MMWGEGGEKSLVDEDLGQVPRQVPFASSGGKPVPEKPVFKGAGGQGNLPRLEIGYGSSGRISRELEGDAKDGVGTSSYS